MLGEAIILAGSSGFTEIRSINPDFSSLAVKIQDKPYLETLFLQLKRNGVKHVVVSIPEDVAALRDYYGLKVDEIELSWIERKDEVKSGLALVQAGKLLNNQHCFVLYDSAFFDVPFRKFAEFHFLNESSLSIALPLVKHLDKDLSVEISGTRITSLGQSGEFEESFVNGGVYLMNTKIFDAVTHIENFSLIDDFVKGYCSRMNFNGFTHDSFFANLAKAGDVHQLERIQKSYQR
jgi:D-glycero-alpha-D-manno-heptose 1-phosphate guanylyltransferase